MKESQAPGLLNPECLNRGSHAASRIRMPQSSPPSCPGQSCLVYVSSAALAKGAAVWAFVGEHPAALPEEGDSYPAKFPLKIHPCRQLSDVCDGNTRKDFDLQQQSRPEPGEPGWLPATACFLQCLCLWSRPGGHRAPSPHVELGPCSEALEALSTNLETEQSAHIYMVLFMELSGSERHRSSFPCLSHTVCLSHA